MRRAVADPRAATALEAAVALADSTGMRAVTLRSVAAGAAMPLRALQHDFGSRDRLVAAMIQHVLTSRAPATPTEADPVAALTHLGDQEWAAYRRHPWLVVELASTRPPLVPAVLGSARAAVDVFTSTGLDRDAALDRYLALSAYIQGMGLLLVVEQQESGRSGADQHAWWRAEMRRLERTGTTMRHPWLAALADRPEATEFNIDATFRDGLHRVVRGLVQADEQ